MPNAPVLVRNGASVFVCGSATQDEDEVITRRLLEAVGTCDKVPELFMDTITALTGSGPAYVSNNFSGHDHPCVPLVLVALLNAK
jgi:pyrroline-5-carboxylate reductase